MCSSDLYELARAGWMVTVVDRGAFGAGCSHGNCGYICPSHVLPLAGPGAIGTTLKTLFQKNSPLKVHPGFALTHLGWFLRFAAKCNRSDLLKSAVGIQALLDSSRRLYDEFLGREGPDVEWDDRGLLFVFRTAAAFEHYAETDSLLRSRFDRGADRFAANELAELEPGLKRESISGGYLYRGDAQLRPDRLMAALKAILLKLGVAIREGEPVLGLQATNDRSQCLGVRSERGTIAADAIVFATGAWSARWAGELGMSIPVVPGKGYSITMPKPANGPKYPMIFEEDRVAVSPFETGLRIGSTMEFAGYDESLKPERLRLLTDAASKYLHDPGDAARATEHWWGWRPMTPSGLPIIDRSRRYENVWLAAGHGMLGLSMATGTARLLRERMTGESPHIDPVPYGARR